MATFNGGRFIRDQLDSLRAQTLQPYELIVSDDGSTDDTLAQVERFQDNVSFRVVIRRNEARLGYGANFLAALATASGEYVAFCDQDDVWFPHKLAHAVKALQQEQAELYVHAARLIDVTGRDVGPFSQRMKDGCRVHSQLLLNPWGVFYGFSMVFKRDLITLIDPARRGAHTFEFRGHLSHDLWIYFLASNLGRVVTDARPLAQYRQHHDNQTPHVRGPWFRSWIVSLGVAAHPELRRDLIALHRAQLLADVSRSAGDDELRSAAAKAAAYWTCLARHEAARIALYAAPGMPERAAALVRLALSGGYLSFRRNGLGWRLLVKDVLVGVLPARQWRDMYWRKA